MFWSQEDGSPAQPATAGGPAGPPGLADLSLERLEREITELASHLYAGTCRWLELIAELDRRQGWGRWGCRSCAEWVAWQCSVSPRAAREQVRVARRLAELPLVHAAFSRGELSYSKVRALSRVAGPETEADLMELSRHATAAQIERVCRALRHIADEEAGRLHAERYLRFSWENDGSLSVQAKLPPEEGARLLEALEAAHEVLRDREDERGGPAGPGNTPRGPAGPGEGPHGPAEPPDDQPAEPDEHPRATHADALGAMAELALAGAAPRSGGERHQLVVHVHSSTLSGDRPDKGRAPPPSLEHGPSIAPETARRLACECSLVRIDEHAGATLGVGRRSRSVPPALGRALRDRDRHCRFPGCENRRFLDSHHIRHWAAGGETSLPNLVRLCRHHHRLVHEGGFSVKRLPDRSLRFRRPDGTAIRAAPPLPEVDPGPAERVRESREFGRSILDDVRGIGVEASPGPGALLSGSGERMDLRHTIDVLVSRGCA